MSTTAVSEPDVQEQALEALLAGFGLRGADALPLLRRVAEKVVAVKTEDAAFERVRLRSLGVEDEILAEEGGALSDAQFTRRLNLRSRQSIHNYREAGKIFAVPRGFRNLAYPAWQIHQGALLAGLPETLGILRRKNTSPMSIVLFFLTPAEALDDKRPLDLLRQNEPDEVLLHAERYGIIGT